MLGLKDHQLATVMAAADGLPIEKRDLFMQRIVARLQLDDYRCSDADLDQAVQLALTGLRHAKAG